VKRGVLYIVWGQGIEPMLQRSMRSVRAIYPDMPIHVVRGQEDAVYGLAQKAKMGAVTPFESTLYLDADTVVLGNLDFAFERAEEFGLACSICECPWLRRYGAAEGDQIEYNTGVLFFSPASKRVFEAWDSLARTTPGRSRWLTMNGVLQGMEYDDQASFARAVRISGFNPHVLPINYNFRPHFYPTVFAPLKVWHGRHEVPEVLATMSGECERGERLVTYVTLRIADAS
jgi:hypothetical protein